ncbi:sperm flagellar protein 1-like [Rhopilema esculentum]|uniref:sperm flagellar protein 1-like n=1 Tax=Rhopilema esculentum TaxID=499914 RepID=UPI0031D4671B
MTSENFDFELDETALQDLYTWIDEIPLTRPKKNISRDFSDGVLVAEIVHHFLPKVIDLHNYVAANGNQAKADNWNLLTRKVLTKLGYNVPQQLTKGIISSKPGDIEKFLYRLRQKIETFQAKKKAAALREKEQVYDELGGEMSSRSEEYYAQNLPYNDGSYRPPNGQLGGYAIDYGSNGVGQNHPFYPPTNQQQPQQQPPYYYQSEPRTIPDNRTYPPMGPDNSKQRQFSESSPRSNGVVPGKAGDKRVSVQPPNQNENELQALKIALEEKEQALLSSQETVQILNVKVRRLEHLLHLKNLRIDDLTSKLNGTQRITPQNQMAHPPMQNQNFSSPPGPGYGQVQPLKPHPPLPDIAPKAGVTRHYR